jgi:hypothetical protein
VREINESGLGVEITQEKLLSCLLYADDIVLITDNKHKLQKMLDIVTSYSKKWKFELNPKKSEVVVFGMRYPPRNLKLKLGGNTLQTVGMYKYLGIELTRTLNWRPYLKRILEKAKRNMTQACGMGITGGFMGVKIGEIIWTSLGRSIVEYGCEIWGDQPLTDFEKLQTDMGRRILRCGVRMSNDVVRGEMGWETLRARRDEMRLRYWRKIVNMDKDRIVKIIYNESKKRMEKEEQEGKTLTPTWCRYTRNLLKDLGLGETWETEDTGHEEDWNDLIRTRIHEREEKEWRESMSESTKLRTYVTLKKKLERETYLEIRNRWGVVEMTKIRGGTNRLRIEKGRYQQLPREERICVFCHTREIEDETHFMLKCPLYTDLREEMWTSVEEITGTKQEELKEEEKLNVLIGDRFSGEELRSIRKEVGVVVIRFICMSMKRRRIREGVLSVKDGVRAPHSEVSTL